MNPEPSSANFVRRRRGKLIVVLIDGVSGRYFGRWRARMPHLDALASRGLVVERLATDACATSLPGRTSVLTGAGGDRHGVYGNRIWDGDRFRHANPDDVRTPTLAARARAGGLDVAVLGYGMVRPEDSTTYQPPWWVREWIQRGRDARPLPIDGGWRRALAERDPGGRLRQAREGGRPAALATAADSAAGRLLAGFASDHAIMSWVAALAGAPQSPDLILTEINMTDEVQHVHGYESDAAHFAIASADALVGLLTAALERAGRAGDYTVAVTSDHGHAPVSSAIYVDTVLGDLPWESEGGTMHLVARGRAHLLDCRARLAEHGAEFIDSGHVPADVRGRIATFVAPPGHSFEARPAGAGADAVHGPPKYRSTHGFRPGSAEDERFAVFAGPGIAATVCPHAAAAQFTATAAAVLGIHDARHDGEPLL